MAVTVSPNSLRRSVLLVDDDPVLLRVLRAMAERSGYSVRTAAAVDEALQCLRDDLNIGFVLSDVDLPEKSGIELLYLLRQRQDMCDIPVAMMTGGSGCEVPPEVTLLRKPIFRAQLLCLLVQHLGGRCPYGPQCEPVDKAAPSAFDNCRNCPAGQNNQSDFIEPSCRHS